LIRQISIIFYIFYPKQSILAFLILFFLFKRTTKTTFLDYSSWTCDLEVDWTQIPIHSKTQAEESLARAYHKLNMDTDACGAFIDLCVYIYWTVNFIEEKSMIEKLKPCIAVNTRRLFNPKSMLKSMLIRCFCFSSCGWVWGWVQPIYAQNSITKVIFYCFFSFFNGFHT